MYNNQCQYLDWKKLCQLQDQRNNLEDLNNKQANKTTSPRGTWGQPQYEEQHNTAIKYGMQCIISCKCMSGTQNIGNNRKAKRTITSTVTHHRVSEATRSHPVENRVAHRRTARKPPARSHGIASGPTTRQPLSRSLKLRAMRTAHRTLQMHSIVVIQHRTAPREKRSNRATYIARLPKESRAQYAMQMH
ncbi:hypothetical protein F511_33996 [Dorcoceras hygrometricum]|uniref:Uncharacterized protein n=1 Tax=Dorcoceras hygrometricum TaxID=472368 RepID=A0A2Z7BGZ1_9LAMI|nr:hypothetical protein F511_33996 [Dorcoceras hygrometricum]